MSRFRLGVLLPLLLLIAQHGAVLHELSHVAYLGHAHCAQAQPVANLPDNAVCVTCYSFAQVMSPHAGSLATLLAPDTARLRSLDSANAVISAESPTPRSRGPPLPFA